MNIEKLKSLFENSTDKYKVAKEIGTTYQSLYNLIYKGSICKVDLLEKIANYYNVPVGYFFDEVSLTNVTANGVHAIATAGDVSLGANSANGNNITTQNNYGYNLSGEHKDNVTTLTETVATLTRELETSQQQKSDLIGVVSTSQKQIEQLTNIIDRLTQ
nr:MAG TPA: SOS-response transcriptional repressor [Caudoviricetes sp.]